MNARNTDRVPSSHASFQFGIEISKSEGFELRTLLRYQSNPPKGLSEKALPGSKNSTNYSERYPNDPRSLPIWKFLGFCVGSLMGMFL
jgi:hypothetical protein